MIGVQEEKWLMQEARKKSQTRSRKLWSPGSRGAWESDGHVHERDLHEACQRIVMEAWWLHRDAHSQTVAGRAMKMCYVVAFHMILILLRADMEVQIVELLRCSVVVRCEVCEANQRRSRSHARGGGHFSRRF